MVNNINIVSSKSINQKNNNSGIKYIKIDHSAISLSKELISKTEHYSFSQHMHILSMMVNKFSFEILETKINNFTKKILLYFYIENINYKFTFKKPHVVCEVMFIVLENFKLQHQNFNVKEYIKLDFMNLFLEIIMSYDINNEINKNESFQMSKHFLYLDYYGFDYDIKTKMIFIFLKISKLFCINVFNFYLLYDYLNKNKPMMNENHKLELSKFCCFIIKSNFEEFKKNNNNSFFNFVELCFLDLYDDFEYASIHENLMQTFSYISDINFHYTYELLAKERFQKELFKLKNNLLSKYNENILDNFIIFFDLDRKSF